jgi:N-acylneuraminate cytidylyltransferase
MQKIALVCCRAGSKGVKNKNIKLFNGKPLLWWTAKSIIDSKLFNKVYLSTDSSKIAKIGIKLGFIVPGLRPKRLAQDNSDVFETHKYFFKKNNIDDNNSIVCIINNNPFISANIIKKSFRIFKKKKYRIIVMLARDIDTDQIFYRQFFLKNSLLFPLFKKQLTNSKINRNVSRSIMSNIGDLRWGKPSQLKNFKEFNNTIVKNGFNFIKINDAYYQDINTNEDWKIAQNKFRHIY